MVYKCDECGATSEEKKSCCDADMKESEEETKEEPESKEEEKIEDEM